MSDLTEMCDAMIIQLAPDIARLNPHEAAVTYEPLTLANNMVGLARLIAKWLTAVTADDIDDAISEWHEGAEGGAELHEFLGWSIEEYAAWVSDPRAIPRRALSPEAVQAVNDWRAKDETQR